MRKEFIAAGIISVSTLIILILHHTNHIDRAHSSFENYFRFRKCEELVERTDEFATCRLSNGKIIKIVEFEDRWYLDGDLPGVW